MSDIQQSVQDFLRGLAGCIERNEIAVRNIGVGDSPSMNHADSGLVTIKWTPTIEFVVVSPATAGLYDILSAAVYSQYEANGRNKPTLTDDQRRSMVSAVKEIRRGVGKS